MRPRGGKPPERGDTLEASHNLEEPKLVTARGFEPYLLGSEALGTSYICLAVRFGTCLRIESAASLPLDDAVMLLSAEGNDTPIVCFEGTFFADFL